MARCAKAALLHVESHDDVSSKTGILVIAPRQGPEKQKEEARKEMQERGFLIVFTPFQ